MNIVVAKIRKILISKIEKLVFHAEYGGGESYTSRFVDFALILERHLSI
jgi:hypothetical protein